MAIGKTTVKGILFILFMALAGCSQKAFMVKSMDPIMDDMRTAVNMNTDVDLLRDAMPASLIQLDGFIVAAPDDKLILRAAEGYFGYANSFVEDTDKKRAGQLYIKARDYGLRVLKGYSWFSKALDGPEPAFKEMLYGFGRGDVPALFWTANSWLAWIGLNPDDPQAMMDLPKVIDMLDRVVELDESYYYGCAHMALGTYYASLPRMLGDNTAKAKKHFDKAFEISGGKLLLVHYMYAKFYAYQIQDRDLFVKTLEKVLQTPSETYPDMAFVNEVARRKAKVLLDNVDMYF
ncbi:MAG TPA: TRAP transporter TatT component family protein [Desulfomonilia bacterium]|nr:TRAP transporter TatT component family protein [Desulfomonilia bacterium]